MNTRYAVRVFGTAAIFNVVVGVSGLLAPSVGSRVLGVPLPENRVFLHIAMWLIAVLGVGYALVALRPARNRDLMLVGGIGKMLVLPLMLAAWRRGDVAAPGIGAGVIDFVLAVLFFDVMRRFPARA